MMITCNKETAGMQNEIWHQFGIQNYNGAILSVYSVILTMAPERAMKTMQNIGAPAI